MKNKYNLAVIYLLLSFCLLAAGNCYAIDTLDEKKPIAVLVQLRSEHNMIAAMTRDRRYKQLNEAIHDAIAVRTAMINDFKDRFDDCPVYYYLDTNAYLVKEKKFAGILLDTNLKPAKSIIIDSTTTNYLIAYYGYPVEGSIREGENIDSSATKHSFDYYGYPLRDPINEVDNKNKVPTTAYIPVMGKGLIILNSDFKQVNYYLKREYDNLFIWMHSKRKYYYFSKKFDIEYYPFASHFSNSKTDKYGNHHHSAWKYDEQD
jgi:hypothetical protein